ncbi:hypothetical protein RFI_02271, partial [Reticulomyxa filosa]
LFDKFLNAVYLKKKKKICFSCILVYQFFFENGLLFFVQQISNLFRNINVVISKEDRNGTSTSNYELCTNFQFIFLLKYKTITKTYSIGRTTKKSKIDNDAYNKNPVATVNKKLKSRISRESVNIIFTDEKKWEQSDDCGNDEIMGCYLDSLPIILCYLWKKVLNNNEKEQKNAHIFGAANSILDAILRRDTYLSTSCTISNVKPISNKINYSTAFPDVILSLTKETCRKEEPINPFIVVDFKVPCKLSIFDHSNENLYKIWKSRGRYHIRVNKFKLVDPVLQIAGYMVWSGSRIGMLLAYPLAVWFEIDEITGNEDVFNIRVYPLLKIDSFECGMLEIVRILKYASKLAPNKKMLRKNIDEVKGEGEVGEEEKKKIKTLSQFRADGINKTEKKQEKKTIRGEENKFFGVICN